MNIWVIADTHFNHKNLCIYEGRPSDFTEQIIANWKRLVRDGDTIIHLGDVIVGRNSELGSIMESLPGFKILTKGNHDKNSDQWYIERGFDIVRNSYELPGIIFSHEPIIPLPQYAKINIHGHFHKFGEGHRTTAEKNPYFAKNQKKYRLVEVESSLAPVKLSDYTKGVL